MSATARQVLGIDFGTTNLRLRTARYDPHGRPLAEPALVRLAGSERDGALPAVLELDPDGKAIHCGRPALLKLAQSGGPGFVAEFKTCIGQAEEDLRAQGRPERARYCSNPHCPHPGWSWSLAMRFCGFCGSALEQPAEAGWRPQFHYDQESALHCAGALLQHLAGRIQAQMPKPLADGGWLVNVGCPVHWSQATRERFLGVLQRAFPGVPVALVDEPVAALRYHHVYRTLGDASGLALIVDLGGATTSLVLAQMSDQGGRPHLEALLSYGERYGGTDFDLVLAGYAASTLQVTLEGNLQMLWRLQAREWKERFSACAGQEEEVATLAFPVPRPGDGFEPVSLGLDRKTFETVTADLLARFESVLERGIEHFGTNPSEVDKVLLTGGGAHWYFVEDTVRRMFPRATVLRGSEPQEVVAKGLALIATLAGARRSTGGVRGADRRSGVVVSYEEMQAGCRKQVDVDGLPEWIAIPAGVRPGQELRFRGRGAPGPEGGVPGDLVVRVEVLPGGGTRGPDVRTSLVLTQSEARAGRSASVETPLGGVLVTLPAGAAEGQEIRLAGLGSQGEDGGPPGDLVVELRVVPDPVRGQDLHLTVPLAWMEARDGCEKSILTEAGERRLRFAKGIPSGAELRYRGLGYPGEHGGAAGDLLVHVEVGSPPPRGRDVTCTLELTREEARRGTLRSLGRASCPDIPVPPGARDGQILRVPGGGEPAETGGEPGDLIVQLHVPPEPVPGGIITRSLCLSEEEANRGGTWTLDVLGRQVEVRVPPGTVSDCPLRFPGQGYPGRHGGTPGDLVVLVEIEEDVEVGCRG